VPSVPLAAQVYRTHLLGTFEPYSVAVCDDQPNI
jgi:hypothetical protein